MSSELKIIPEETALIVIDPQNAFCDAEGTLGQSGVDMTSLAGLVPYMERLVRTCRSAGIRDVWTRHYNLPSDRARDAKRIKPHTLKRARIACQPGTWDSEFVEPLKALVEPDTPVLEKYRWSAFYNTGLDVMLRTWGTRLVIVCGSTTNACIETTVREAYMRDYDVLVVKEGVAGVRQHWHEASLEIWKHYVGEVVDMSEFEAMLPAGTEETS